MPLRSQKRRLRRHSQPSRISSLIATFQEWNRSVRSEKPVLSIPIIFTAAFLGAPMSRIDNEAECRFKEVPFARIRRWCSEAVSQRKSDASVPGVVADRFEALQTIGNCHAGDVLHALVPELARNTEPQRTTMP